MLFVELFNQILRDLMMSCISVHLRLWLKSVVVLVSLSFSASAC